MGLTAEQLQMAGLIDARVKAIAKSGCNLIGPLLQAAGKQGDFRRTLFHTKEECRASISRNKRFQMPFWRFSGEKSRKEAV
jgi:hypothetical protein